MGNPMKLLINHDYKVQKKETLADLLRRLHAGLVETGLPISCQAAFADSPASGGISAVNRAVKKFPQLAAFITTDPLPGSALPGPQVITGDETQIPFETIAEIADGVPRSLPFNAVNIRFSSPAFGTAQLPKQPTLVQCGIGVQDCWWVTGRMRGLRASYVVEVPSASKKVPLPDGPLGVFLATLGKPKATVQFPIKEDPAGDTVVLRQGSAASPELVALAQSIRAKLPELIAAARMPHEITEANALVATHPLKPALVKHFKPLGYACKGGSGTFTLRRRTPENHVVEVELDVGTWSRRLMAHFRVHVPDFRFTLPMPAAPGLTALQCSIGDAERWEKLVENLAALTTYLDREVVQKISEAAGPAPDWFDEPA